ncbi:MAG: 5-hydroxyisourate hydrolase [Gammaproteobacteria bacterium]|jgi:5-hydroxyisourate hydrolase
MSKLSTHVLDTSIGKPAEGVKIDFSIFEANGSRLIKSLATNKDGRTDELLLDADSMRAGDYEILFHIGDYFSAKGVALGDRPFLNKIPIRFSIANPEQNFHVPLVVTPWSYSTYRGS